VWAGGLPGQGDPFTQPQAFWTWTTDHSGGPGSPWAHSGRVPGVGQTQASQAWADLPTLIGHRWRDDQADDITLDGRPSQSCSVGGLGSYNSERPTCPGTQVGRGLGQCWWLQDSRQFAKPGSDSEIKFGLIRQTWRLTPGSELTWANRGPGRDGREHRSPGFTFPRDGQTGPIPHLIQVPAHYPLGPDGFGPGDPRTGRSSRMPQEPTPAPGADQNQADQAGPGLSVLGD